MSNATIALCIPAYNAASFLPRLLISVQKQEIPFDEILVYNDCSTDNTSEVAQKYGATVVEGDVNRGCAEGKNKLLEICQSDWIHFHDADDELISNFTKLAHRWINQDEVADVILFNYEYRDNETNELLSIRRFNKKLLEKDALNYAIREQINPFCGVYRKSKLLEVKGYDVDPRVLYNEDVAFHIKLAAAGFSFSVEEDVSIINYRIENSMSQGNKIKCIQAHFEVMKKTVLSVPKDYYEPIAYELVKTAGLAAAEKDFETADAAVNLASQIWPEPFTESSTYFKTLASLNPKWALRVREFLIRKFKPSLRND